MTEFAASDNLLAELPVPQANRLRMIEAACRRISAARFPSKAFAAEAEELSRQLAEEPGAAGRAISAKTMTRLYYKWRKAGEKIEALLDGRMSELNRNRARTSSAAFRAHLALLATRHKRCLRSAVRELYKEWRSCKTIPGYEGCNHTPGMELPAGWSYDNLVRLMPAREELAVVTEGVMSAAGYLAQTRGTREGCWPCSHVMFDDVWLDLLAVGYDETGKLQLNRPLQLGCLDYYTGRRLCWGTKIRTKREDGTSAQLNSDEMLFLLCDFLYNVGYSPRGTKLVVEHGTATLSAAVAKQLELLTGGLVTVTMSGRPGIRQVGEYEGCAAGNPRFKASLEVWHSLLHNHMDHYATHTGRNRTEPEALWGLRKFEESMLAKAGQLPPAQALALFPLAPRLGELCDDLAKLVVQINTRTEHNLEGWEACGFTCYEFSLNGVDGWRDISTLDPAAAQLAATMATSNPSLMRERKLSPQEAWEREIAKPENRLIRFTAAECVALMGAHRKFNLTARGGVFEIKAKSKHHEQLIFDACVKDSTGRERLLPAGGGYFGILNPLNRNLFILDERDRVLGEAPLRSRFSHADELARLREFGRVQHLRAEQLAHAEALAAEDISAARVRRDYNQRVLDGQPVDALGLADAETLQAPRRRPAKRRREYVPLPEPEGLGLADSYDPTYFNP